MEFETSEDAIKFAKKNFLEILFVEDLVIDVTQFKLTHPAGIEVIDKYLFKDVSESYFNISSHNSQTGILELKNYTIGRVKDCKKLANEKREIVDDYPIDLTKGSVYQVLTKLNKEQYLRFIHDPRHLAYPKESIMFDSPYLEIFTKNPWYAIPIIWLPFTLYIIYQAYTIQNLTALQISICFPIGVVLWTYIEYALHRFVFHFDEKLPDNNVAFLLHFLLHGVHHAFPMDR